MTDTATKGVTTQPEALEALEGLAPGDPGHRDRLVASVLQPVSLALGVVYLLVTGIDLVLEQRALTSLDVLTSLATSLAFLMVYVGLRWRDVPEGWGHRVAAGIVLLAVANTVFAYVSDGSVLASMDLVLGALAIGAFLLSHRWFAGLATVILLVFAGFVSLDPGNPAWTTLAPLLLGATVLGWIVMWSRLRNLRRLAVLRRRDAEQQAALRDALEEARRLRAEAERRESHAGRTLDELEERNEELEEVTRGVVGGLREPLQTARKHLRRVREAEDGASVADELRDAHVGVRSAERALRGLGQAARVERDTSTVRPVDLDEIVDVELEELAARVEASGADVAVEGDLPRVMGVRGQLRLLFRHLLDNALRYAGDAPRVRVRAGNPEDASGRIRVVVEDDGPGVPEDARERVLERFQRGPGREDVPGAGLGLAVSKRIVEKHGGRIWVEEAPSGGTRVLFTLNPVRGIKGGA